MKSGNLYRNMSVSLLFVLTFAGLSSYALAAPATLTQSVTYNSETITMQLTRENLRGSNFELWKQNSSGGYDVVAPVEERSYIGTVDEYPDAISCGVLGDDGTFRGAVYFDRGVSWFTLNNSVVDTRALDYATFSAYQYPSAPSVQAGQAGLDMYGYEVGVDADYDFFNGAGGGNIATSFEHIEYSVCLVRAIYMKDVLLQPYLGRVIIRANLPYDPYTGLTQGDYLGAVRTEWNSNHTDTDPDVVAGVSPSKIGGGLAWVGVVGTSSGYSVSQSSNSNGRFDVVWRHEMGHNWGLGHYVGGSPEGAGLNGGNQPARFSSCEAYVTFNHRDSRSAGILDNLGSYTAINLPPYAALDAVEIVQTVSTSLTIDVLANDYDANGGSVSLDSYDATSALGGTIALQGQNLIYTAPDAYPAVDYFLYTITDSTGQTATGVVIIDLKPAFVIIPTDIFYTNRYEGEEAVLTSRTYTLENNGTSALNWTASKTESWYDLSASGGSIPAGGSATVDVTLNSGIEALALGAYTDTITFDDTTNGTTLLRDVEYVYEIPRISQANWTLEYVDSEETSGEDGAAINAFDGDSSSIWHTEWDASNPAHPHEIQIDLGRSYDVRGFAYLPRQNNANGRIANYKFYVSEDGSNWGSAVASGTFANTADEQDSLFTVVSARYIRLVALSEVNGNAWTSVAELNVYHVPLPLIPQSAMSLHYVDSQETSAEDGAAINAFDGDTATIWHTQYWGSTPTHPHEIQIDLGGSYDVKGFKYLPRQNSENGRIANYEFYVSTDGSSWGSAVATGTFANTADEQEVLFTEVSASYVRLVALSEVNGNAWTSVAELNVYGASAGAFTGDMFVKSSALEGVDYADVLTDTVIEGSNVSFSKLAGPLWLDVAADGTLSGIAGDSNVGLNSFTIRATDTVGGLFDDATIQVTVLNTFTGELGLPDFASLADHWLDSGCVDVPACGGADLTGDGAVGLDDLRRFAWLWLADYGTDGFVGRWTFDTDASDAVGDSDGVLTNGAAVTATDPVVGIGALSLDGIDDYVEMAGYYGIAGTASRTVSAWVKTTAVDAEIVTWGDVTVNGGRWIMRTAASGVLRVEVGSGKVEGTATLTDGQWHHVAAVLIDDGSPNVNEIQLFVDGQPDALSSAGNIAINTVATLPVRVGICIEEGGDRHFNGIIDDVRIYERAMTAGEVAGLFAN